MSDDRFKQARRSLIDRHNQRQQQQEGDWESGPSGDTFDGDFEDEKTAMVEIPQTGPPSAPSAPVSPPFDDDEKTEMISIDRAQLEASGQQGPGGGVQIRSHSGVQPSYEGFRSERAPPPAGHGQNPDPQRFAPDPQPQPRQTSSPPPSDSGGDQRDPRQSLVIGGEGGYDGNTQFLNLNEFADGESFTPDDTAAGYEGSTQFVNIGALQAGAAAGGQMPVEHDPALKEQYRFGPESIQDGEFTLIFAQNMEGRPVVLKRIWEGDPNGMPIPVRQRVQALDQIRHPRLISLNGMLASQTGAWVELNRPPGYRLTDIVHEHGPQPQETVVAWIAQAAEILGAIHQQGFVYGNLTTDAIWVQDDGSVLLEPFDVLAFESRGNLGVFGPPEMNFPPEQRQLLPATDIYCLAAVTVGALTGLPLNLGAVEALDKNIASAVGAALQQNPQERPQTTADFAERLQKTGGLPDLDFKFLLVGVAVLGIAGLGVAYYLQQQQQATPPQNVPSPVDGVAEIPRDESGESSVTAGTNGEAPDPEAEAVPTVASPGEVDQDPRLTIAKSYQINPPAEEVEDAPDPNNPKAQALRAEARELLVGIEELVAEQQREKYAAAMQKLAAAIRLSGGPTAEDHELMEDLFERGDVKKIQKDYFDRVNENLFKERVSRAKAIYPQLAAIDASANEIEFFTRNKNLGVTKLTRAGEGSGNGSGDESEEE